ncbi:Gfo/Idh/MocA family protein [Lachnoclostridium sp. Marseille-P6806]|uniref:Gfo/Idh/MocA family protein n=1 Tax=Lachnoclostridium sp. Marseille-P6806 TaxID=2364793 RepID=UPI001030E524|nr:Gfo/Idh/MocA family oxidoreductase [Lachnoclostridium sp. Marseille-P6806]
MRRVGVGIIGCGVISSVYLRDLQRLWEKELCIRAVADAVEERAREQAEKFGIAQACSVEELLCDGSIELVINLTPPRSHTELNRRILAAGKNLFCEKPFALTLEDAQGTLALAEEKGLRIGCAPDTFLGSSFKTCRKLVKDGWIGKALYVSANMMNSGVETWHPEPYSYYREGGGPICDMGGYYFAALVSLFGEAASVYAVSGTGWQEREIFSQPHFGDRIPVETPTFYSIVLTMRSGVLVTMNFSFDIWHSSLPMFEIYGTDGTLNVPDPNMYGGVPQIYRKEQKLAGSFGGTDTGNGEPLRLPELFQDVGEYVRGAGVAELARAIAEDGMNESNGMLGVHVVDIMTGIMRSAETGRPYELVTHYETAVAVK